MIKLGSYAAHSTRITSFHLLSSFIVVKSADKIELQ